MRRLLLEHALLPAGFAADVALDVDGGRIVSVTPESAETGRERIGGIAVPGMPNLHSHAFQRGMAGLAEISGPADDSFWTWRKVMYHFLEELIPEDIQVIATYAYIEMLEAGFSTVGEFHYLHNDASGRAYDAPEELSLRIIEAARESGINLTLLPCFYAYGQVGGGAPEAGQRRFIKDVDGFCDLMERTQKALADLPGARLGIAPHSLRAVTPETLDELLHTFPAGPIHIHAAEQVKEVEDCVAWSGRRPVEWLLENAGVDERWCLVHSTHMTPEEVSGLARSGAVAGLCPLTEANLGDGFFAASEYLAAGGRFGVGTDSNIELTAAGELKQLEYSQRLKVRGRNVLAEREGRSVGLSLYRKALAGGAQALGREEPALAPDKPADIVILRGDHPDFVAPKGDRGLDPYIFVAGRNAIDRVIVRGEEVVSGGRHHGRDAAEQKYREVLKRLATV